MRILFLLFALALVPLTVRAETILVNSSEGGIFLVHVETQAVRRLTTGPQLFDVAVSPDGEILGVSGSGQLWRIDPKGAHWPMGALGVFLNALAFDPSGTLVGAGNQSVVRIATDPPGTRLMGDYPGFFSSGDLAFGPDGALYATGSPGPEYMDTLFRLQTRGGMEALGPIGFRNVYGLVWSPHYRTLIGVTEARELITVDQDTGAGRLLGRLNFPGRGYGAAAIGGGPATLSLLGWPNPVSERHSELSFP